MNTLTECVKDFKMFWIRDVRTQRSLLVCKYLFKIADDVYVFQKNVKVQDQGHKVKNYSMQDTPNLCFNGLKAFFLIIQTFIYVFITRLYHNYLQILQQQILWLTSHSLQIDWLTSIQHFYKSKIMALLPSSLMYCWYLYNQELPTFPMKMLPIRVRTLHPAGFWPLPDWGQQGPGFHRLWWAQSSREGRSNIPPPGGSTTIWYGPGFDRI